MVSVLHVSVVCGALFFIRVQLTVSPTISAVVYPLDRYIILIDAREKAEALRRIDSALKMAVCRTLTQWCSKNVNVTRSALAGFGSTRSDLRSLSLLFSRVARCSTLIASAFGTCLALPTLAVLTTYSHHTFSFRRCSLGRCPGAQAESARR